MTKLEICGENVENMDSFLIGVRWASKVLNKIAEGQDNETCRKVCEGVVASFNSNRLRMIEKVRKIEKDSLTSVEGDNKVAP